MNDNFETLISSMKEKTKYREPLMIIGVEVFDFKETGWHGNAHPGILKHIAVIGGYFRLYI
jgi:hypothetical protein